MSRSRDFSRMSGLPDMDVLTERDIFEDQMKMLDLELKLESRERERMRFDLSMAKGKLDLDRQEEELFRERAEREELEDVSAEMESKLAELDFDDPDYGSNATAVLDEYVGAAAGNKSVQSLITNHTNNIRIHSDVAKRNKISNRESGKFMLETLKGVTGGNIPYEARSLLQKSIVDGTDIDDDTRSRIGQIGADWALNNLVNIPEAKSLVANIGGKQVSVAEFQKASQSGKATPNIPQELATELSKFSEKQKNAYFLTDGETDSTGDYEILYSAAQRRSQEIQGIRDKEALEIKEYDRAKMINKIREDEIRKSPKYKAAERMNDSSYKLITSALTSINDHLIEAGEPLMNISASSSTSQVNNAVNSALKKVDKMNLKKSEKKALKSNLLNLRVSFKDYGNSGQKLVSLLGNDTKGSGGFDPYNY